MANLVTLADIKQQARERADQEGSDFVSDTELLSYINSSYAEFYDIIVSRFEDYYTIESSQVIANGESSIAFPSDFYKFRGLDRNYNGVAEFIAVPKYNWNERNRTNSQLLGRTNIFNLQYRLVKNSIRIIPPEAAAGTYRLWYIPTFTRLVNETDEIDGFNGFEEYIVVDTAIKMMQKEESDVSVLLAQKAALMERIENMAQQRDADQPETIQDIDEIGDGYEYGRGTGPWF